MNIMIVTHNKYLELGLKKLLSRHSITIGADFFIPDNREHIINNNIFYAINFIFLDDIFNCFVDPNKEITIITYNFHIKRPTLQLTDKPFISTFIFEIFS